MTSLLTSTFPTPALDHHLGLAHLLTADPHRAERHLFSREPGALVRLGVGAEADPRSLQALRHQGEVLLHDVEVDQQGGRFDFTHRRSNALGGGAWEILFREKSLFSS